MNIKCIAVVADEREMPEAGVATAVAVLRSVIGDCQLMASVYLFGQSDAIAMTNDRAVAQVLADNLGCAILLPDDDEQDASLFVRFRPAMPRDRVSVDLERLDQQGQVRVMATAAS